LTCQHGGLARGIDHPLAGDLTLGAVFQRDPHAVRLIARAQFQLAQGRWAVNFSPGFRCKFEQMLIQQRAV